MGALFANKENAFNGGAVAFPNGFKFIHHFACK